MSRRKIHAIIFLRGLLLAAAVACIFAGVSRGEAAIVLRKAVRICLECIGVAG